MHRPPRNRVIYLSSVSLFWGWELNLVIIVEAEISMGKDEVVVIIVKEFIMGIYVVELNLFRLVTCVSHYRVYKWELKLIAVCLTTL